MKYTFILCAILLLLSSCKNEEHNIERGLYHWKSDFILSENQTEFLEDIQTDFLYVRYFDVNVSWEGAYPQSVVGMVSETDIPIIPTVYITTDVMVQLDSFYIRLLAEDVSNKIKAIHGDKELSEVQFDCDWTPSIKDKYFYFLDEVSNYFPGVTISATVRLYQYKYPELAGVPPVDKGLLMYYNMGDLTDYKETNSILNNQKGKEYLGFGEYPLPIDIALPNFQWCLSFRQGIFQYICPDFSKEELNNQDLFSKTGDNTYIFKKDTVMHNDYFRFGDELRHEFCSEQELMKAVNLLKDEMNQETTRILFYDLQPNTYKDYEKMDAVYSAFE